MKNSYLQNLYKLQKWDKELLASACKSVKKFIWNLGISDAFCSFDFLTFARALLKLCGDIEQNPGPEISYDNFSKLSDKNKQNLRIVHMNFQDVSKNILSWNLLWTTWERTQLWVSQKVG